MKHLTLTAVSLLAAVGISSAGDVTGKISLKGTPPPEKPLPLDPACGKARADFSLAPAQTRFYVAGKDGGLADVFVYLKSGVTGKPAVPTTPVNIDQKGCEYSPYISGAMVGQKILVSNSDPVLHNVHPTPVPPNKEYNKAQLPKGPPLEFTWDNAEILLRFKCDVHPWMFAYVGLVDHPYFAVSATDGSFKIANVPPGKYVVEAVHRKTGKPLTQEVTVGADGAKADFTIEVPPAQ